MSQPEPEIAICGGFTPTNKPVTTEIVDMCTAMRDQIQEKAQASGWNGIFTEFTPIAFKTQVVAGTMYAVKAKTGPNHCVHFKIFKPLPHTKQDNELVKVQCGYTEEEDIKFR